MRAKSISNISSAGLTLVEVAMALAIASVVLVILIGALGSTVKFAGEGFDRFAMARISQTLSDENRMLSWEQMESEIKNDRILYFDERGRLKDRKSSETIYAARISLAPGPSLPGASASSIHLRRLVVEVSARGLADDPFSSIHPLRKFAALYSRLDPLNQDTSEE